jgi:hypothetical protein
VIRALFKVEHRQNPGSRAVVAEQEIVFGARGSVIEKGVVVAEDVDFFGIGRPETEGSVDREGEVAGVGESVAGAESDGAGVDRRGAGKCTNSGEGYGPESLFRYAPRTGYDVRVGVD